jgi:hypothetical protein
MNRLLLSSSFSCAGGLFKGCGRDDALDVWEELAGDVALEATDDLLRAESLGGSARDVVLVAGGADLLAAGFPLLPTGDHPHWTVVLSEPTSFSSLGCGRSSTDPGTTQRGQAGSDVTMTSVDTGNDDLSFDPTDVGPDLVVECWISQSRRANDPLFDPQPGDAISVGRGSAASRQGDSPRREPRVGTGAAHQSLRRGRLISCHTGATFPVTAWYGAPRGDTRKMPADQHFYGS